ncbi:MAG: protease family protein [Moorella sp. (in: firmicutes)]|nr:protease family protein [Moorella sp. (in: firmicutes)]
MSSPHSIYQAGPAPRGASRFKAFLKGQGEFLPWYYGVLLTVAEILTALMYIPAGLALHFSLLVLLILQAALEAGKPRHALYQALTLAPLTRIMSLTLPLGNFPLVWWYAITSLPLLAAAGAAAALSGFKAADLGLTRGRPGRQVLVALSGLPLGFLEYLILRPQPLVAGLDWRHLWLPALILLVCTGFMEELVFRGLIMRAATVAAGPRFALYYMSFIFAILHITHRSVLDVFFVFAVALFFGWAVQRDRSILGVTLAHGLTNITLYLIWPNLL